MALLGAATAGLAATGFGAGAAAACCTFTGSAALADHAKASIDIDVMVNAILPAGLAASTTGCAAGAGAART